MTTKRVYKAYRCRLYPGPEQEAYFRRMFGCCRLVYNHFLAARIAAYEERKVDPEVKVPTHFDLCRMLTDFKRERTDALPLAIAGSRLGAVGLPTPLARLIETTPLEPLG